ncbi:hypothetical protein NDU88_007232 [Pleurodeles waltl]|uniref:Uncharacterized protein n=1 Tax=Pleurodeles waltl TaxID=8319 RepID=A0AAV7WIM3_PLEWA|nr:hypothetical protein NDU88_007232 [Pleurodeles waltl]
MSRPVHTTHCRPLSPPRAHGLRHRPQATDVGGPPLHLCHGMRLGLFMGPVAPLSLRDAAAPAARRPQRLPRLHGDPASSGRPARTAPGRFQSPALRAPIEGTPPHTAAAGLHACGAQARKTRAVEYGHFFTTLMFVTIDEDIMM